MLGRQGLLRRRRRLLYDDLWLCQLLWLLKQLRLLRLLWLLLV